MKSAPDELGSKETLLDKEVELLSIVEFLGGMTQKSGQFTHQLDVQASILIGITSAIFIFSLAKFFDGTKELPLIIIGGFSAVSTLIGLLAIHPPKFMRKVGQEESLMFNKRIANYDSFQEYEKDLIKVLDRPERMVNEYAIELYNLSKYYYRPKRDLFNFSRNCFLTGIVLSLYAFFFEIVVHYLATFPIKW